MTSAPMPSVDIPPDQPEQPDQLEVMSADECTTFLGLSSVGRIAFVIAGRPMVFPVNYRWLADAPGPWVLLRTHPGHSVDMAPAEVAFEIDGIDHEHEQGWSVLVRGTLRHLDADEVERYVGTRFDPKPWVHDSRTAWLAIEPLLTTGRRLHPADYGWVLPSEGYL
jgi:nitroimidazol reductase NimA-like FMN-containing flavoprotein (pyridoxamine 5'-phosphate oxidase superfamily)